MKYLFAILAILIGLVVALGAVAIVAFALVSFVAAPSFWGAFWLVLVALIVFTGASKAL
ncbi:hypothetical protein SEA_FRANKLIN22_62 [Microbacterium phage Franklin22]|uniref:hypothetical protein n=1 Tax=Microbacterium phage Franklin22 TaxID=2894293 RepID=UPI001E7F23F3|nr:hypothetical protein QDW15_gp62 [Microbacterium phage Franklin22]UGL61875.1 hypothetical protein SEA_FRANKLIN22_62 [Microbacterium phage Franklin22]